MHQDTVAPAMGFSTRKQLLSEVTTEKMGECMAAAKGRVSRKELENRVESFAGDPRCAQNVVAGEVGKFGGLVSELPQRPLAERHNRFSTLL